MQHKSNALSGNLRLDDGVRSVKPVLQRMDSPETGSIQSFGLDRAVTILGRDPTSDLVLSPLTVSRRHARILRRGDHYFLEDLGSTAGTQLNGQRVDRPALLHDGDRIEIGGCTFVFVVPDLRDSEPSEAETTILSIREVSGTAERDLASIRPEEKLRALLEVSRNLVGAHRLEGVLRKVLDALFLIFPQAQRGFVLLKEGRAGRLAIRAVKLRGSDSDHVLISRTIFEYVIGNGKAILSEDVAADSRFSGSRSADEAQIRTLMCVPLRDHRRRPVGVLQLDTRDRTSRFTRDDLDLLVAIAGQVSVAVDNARLLDVARQGRRRLAFLAKAGAVLASSLDAEATLAAVARLAVSHVADLCLIDLLQVEGTCRRVAAAHANPTKQVLLDELCRRYPLDPVGPVPALQVLRTGQSELMATIDDAALVATTRDAEHLALVRRLEFRSAILAPLVAQERSLGLLTLVITESDRQYGPGDLKLTEELARRAATALDHAQLYLEAQRARSQAEAASRAKDRFLAVLSHELRTPLTPILAAVSARLARGRDADPELCSELEMIQRNCALEARLIDDLLDISRIERGRLLLDLEVVDVHQMIRQTVEICRDETFVSGLEVVLDLAAPEHHVQGDQARLMQITWNLIRNAAKFTPGGGTLTIRTRNEPREAGATPVLVVAEFEDTGLGIDPEVLPRIFDAFEQGRVDPRGRSGGLGLGLAISRSLAEAHRGRLTATSPGPARGSTFRLELPAVPAPAPTAPPGPATPPPVKATSQPSPRILLVEDNPDSLHFLALILGQRGYDVRTAASLAEARTVAAAGGIGLLLSDVELPDGTGLELMRELRGQGVPGIAMSGFGCEEDVRQSRDAGFEEHLTKPIDYARLEEAIRRVATSPP